RARCFPSSVAPARTTGTGSGPSGPRKVHGMSQTGYVDSNGARLYYEVAGSGPALVFNHAGIADSRMWDDQFDAFAQHHRVARYDTRGFGKSTFPATPFALHEDLHALLQQLRIPRSMFIGCSMGGSTILDFALVYPEMVTALVLVGAGLSGFPNSEEHKDLFEQMEAAITSGDFERANAMEVHLWVDGPNRTPEQVNPAVRERVREMNRIPYERNESDNWRLGQQLDPPAYGRLSEIAVPTLVIVGDQDVANIQRIADALSSGIPGARKVVMQNTAHVPNMERPDEFNRIVLDFLDTLAAG